jgi:hypothetical protein
LAKSVAAPSPRINVKCSTHGHVMMPCRLGSDKHVSTFGQSGRVPQLIAQHLFFSRHWLVSTYRAFFFLNMILTSLDPVAQTFRSHSLHSRPLSSFSLFSNTDMRFYLNLVILALAASTLPPALSAPIQYGYGILILVELEHRALLISGFPLGWFLVPLLVSLIVSSSLVPAGMATDPSQSQSRTLLPTIRVLPLILTLLPPRTGTLLSLPPEADLPPRTGTLISLPPEADLPPRTGTLISLPPETDLPPRT